MTRKHSMHPLPLTVALLFLSLWANIGSARGLDCQAGKVEFLAFGDFGMGNIGQKKVARAMEKFCHRSKCHFALLLGDNIYPDGVESVRDPQWKTKFEEPYSGLKLDFYPSLGNHDYHGSIEAQLDYSKENKKWKMPNRYYAFKKCFIEFFVIDTENFDDDQATWLSDAISKSDADWKIVYGHRPIFSNGGHGNNSSLKKHLLPILKDQTDLYLAGHDHHLEYLTKSYQPDFVISGSAAESRPVAPGKNSLFGASELGFSYLSLEPKKATIQFIDSAGKVLFHQEKLKK